MDLPDDAVLHGNAGFPRDGNRALEGGPEIWPGLRVRFPPSIASHSAEQEFYFGRDHLLRRHDYRLEIGGGTPIAQYVHDIVEADGFQFPSKRRAFPRGPGSKAIRDLLLISIDLSDFHVEKFAG